MTIFTSKGDIGEVFVLFQASKGTSQVLLEVVPLETQLFRHVESSETKTYLNDKMLYNNKIREHDVIVETKVF